MDVLLEYGDEVALILEQGGLPSYVMKRTKAKRSSGSISKSFIPLRPRLDCYKFSFYARTIVEWNMLPPELKSQNTLNLLKLALRRHLKLDYISLCISYECFVAACGNLSGGKLNVLIYCYCY